MANDVLDEETKKLFTYQDSISRWDSMHRRIDALLSYGVNYASDVPSLDALLLNPKKDITAINNQLDSVEYIVMHNEFLRQFKRGHENDEKNDDDSLRPPMQFFFSSPSKGIESGWEANLEKVTGNGLSYMLDRLGIFGKEKKELITIATEGLNDAMQYFRLATKLPKELKTGKRVPPNIFDICKQYNDFLSDNQVTIALKYATDATKSYDKAFSDFYDDKRKEKYEKIKKLRNKRVSDAKIHNRDPTDLQRKLGISEDRLEAYEIKLAKRLVSELAQQVKTDDANKHIATLTELHGKWNFSELMTYIELADIAYNNHWSRPEIVPKEDNCLIIRNGYFYPLGQRRGRMVPNDTYMNLHLSNETRVEVLEGVNSGGKTVDMKKALYVATLALSGSFVPATYARVSVRDKIILRGKGDGQDKSAFQQDVARVNEIIPPNGQYWISALDEPFTSTEADGGMYLTAGVIKTMAEQENSLLILSSHYPSLNEILGNSPKVTFNNFPFIVEGDKVTFPHKKRPGNLKEYAYAIAVAKTREFDVMTLNYASEYLKNQR